MVPVSGGPGKLGLCNSESAVVKGTAQEVLVAQLKRIVEVSKHELDLIRELIAQAVKYKAADALALYPGPVLVAMDLETLQSLYADLTRR